MNAQPLNFKMMTLAACALLALVLLIPIAAQDGGDLTPAAPTATPMFGDRFQLTPTPFPAPGIPISLTGVNATAANATVAIRGGAGLDYRRIGRLTQGRSIDVIGWNGWEEGRACSPDFESDLDMWVQVQFGERRGWIARCVLSFTGRLTDLPIVTESGERIMQR